MAWPLFPIFGITPAGTCACGDPECWAINPATGKHKGSPGKHPMRDLVPHGHRDASTDESQHRAWVRPDQNWGVATGPALGAWVLDVDGEDGKAALAALVATNGPLPPTLTALTGGGGNHYLFRYPVGARVTNRAKNLPNHIDVRGAGGYIVIPPSRHISGGVYRWLDTTTPIAEAPAWLLALVVQPLAPDASPKPLTASRAASTDKAGALLTKAVNAISGAPTGRRNQTLNLWAYTIGGLVGAGELPEDGVWGAMMVAGLAAGLDEGEVEMTLGSGFRSGQARALRTGYYPEDARFTDSFETPRARETQYPPFFRFVGGFLERAKRDIVEEQEYWKVCSHIDVLAETRDFNGEQRGLLLKVQDPEGAYHEWLMPKALLGGDGQAYREKLISLGLQPANRSKWVYDSMHQFLMHTRAARYLRSADQVGWHDEAFVLPDGAIGGTEGEVVVMAARGDHAYRTSGTLADWQAAVAAPCCGNSRLELAVSMAFAAPLLKLAGGFESGGVHLRGVSSCGKSTALKVAGSVWGGGGTTGYVRQWKATDNGLEAAAAGHCDTLLCLDELGQLNARTAAETIYMLGNGSGKARAGLRGEARPVATWRTLFLSSGEISLADKVADTGRKPSAGQEVRIIDLPADAGRGKGAFEDFHGAPHGDAFALGITAATERCYGTAARAFLTWITADLPRARTRLQRHLTSVQAPFDADAQVKRVAHRFALIAAGGEMAIEAGVLPWPVGSAASAARRCFRDWVVARGGVESHEARSGIAQVRSFLETHGGSRFEPVGPSMGAHRLPNQAGYKHRARDDSTEAPWVYYLHDAAWTEATQGFDGKRVAQLLKGKGMLEGDEGRLRKKLRVNGSTPRFYCVLPTIFTGDDSD